MTNPTYQDRHNGDSPTDIVLRSDFQRAFPGVAESLKRAMELLSSVRSFDDIERLFLRGAGLSPNTYSSYLTAVKQFYHFTDGMNPLQVIPADVEAFYDHLVAKVDVSTAYVRIAGLKKFFANVAEHVPIWTSPFDTMLPTLKAKLGKTKPGDKKKALSESELRELLDYLSRWTDWKGQERHAIVLFLYSTGLRSAEACSLTWGDISDVDGTWIATFRQKGGELAEQKVPAATMQTLRQYFQARYRRNPRPEDPLFASNIDTPLSTATLWNYLKAIWRDARAAGICTRKGLEFSAHLFRRTIGTHLAQRGMDLVSVQHFLRHKNLGTTARHYLDCQVDAAPMIAEILGVTT